jgi:hypothetical protein
VSGILARSQPGFVCACLAFALTACAGGSGATDGGDQDAATTDDPGACRSQDLHDCRLRPDCAADLCLECSCTPVFKGCRENTDPPAQCPDLNCPQPECCRATSECDGAQCDPPGASTGCGQCAPDPGDCARDGDCPSGAICDPIPCSCIGNLACTAGCAQPADCGEGKTCDPGNDHPRCLATACSGTTPCVDNFDCTNGACARRPCSADPACERFCVRGSCYAGLGLCRLPVP